MVRRLVGFTVQKTTLTLPASVGAKVCIDNPNLCCAQPCIGHDLPRTLYATMSIWPSGVSGAECLLGSFRMLYGSGTIPYWNIVNETNITLPYTSAFQTFTRPSCATFLPANSGAVPTPYPANIKARGRMECNGTSGLNFYVTVWDGVSSPWLDAYVLAIPSTDSRIVWSPFSANIVMNSGLPTQIRMLVTE